MAAKDGLARLRAKAFAKYLVDFSLLFLMKTAALVVMIVLMIGFNRTQGDGGGKESLGILMLLVAGLHLVLLPSVAAMFHWGHSRLSKTWRQRYLAATTYEELVALNKELLAKIPIQSA